MTLNSVSNLFSVTFFSILLIACSQKAQPLSNVEVSGQEANQSFQQRLEATTQLKQTLQSIQTILQPVDATLKNINKILGSEEQRLQSVAPDFALSELSRVLHSLEDQLLVPQFDDRSQQKVWVAEEQVDWPAGQRWSANGMACDQTVVGILVRDSKEVKPSREAEVYVRDCAFTRTATIARFTFDSEGKVKLNFDSQFLKKLADQVVVTDGCVLAVSAGSSQGGIVCQPFSQSISSVNLVFNAFQYSVTDSGNTMNISLVAYRSDGTKIGDLDFRQEPGKPIEAQVNGSVRSLK